MESTFGRFGIDEVALCYAVTEAFDWIFVVQRW